MSEIMFCFVMTLCENQRLGYYHKVREEESDPST